MPSDLIGPIATAALVALGHALTQIGTELARVAKENPRTGPAKFAGSSSYQNSQKDRNTFLPAFSCANRPAKKFAGFPNRRPRPISPQQWGVAALSR